MAKRRWQIFVAPGEDGEPLIRAETPWCVSRRVAIPLEHWARVLEFAAQVDIGEAGALARLSKAAQDSETDRVFATVAEVHQALAFLTTLESAINRADPLVPVATEEIPEAFNNEEYVRMVQAVAAVFEAALECRQPFRAWIE